MSWWRRSSISKLADKIDLLTERITQHMTTIEDAVHDLTTVTNLLAGNEATLIQELKDALAAAPGNVDTNPRVVAAITAIEGVVANLQTVNQAAVEAITPPAPTT